MAPLRGATSGRQRIAETGLPRLAGRPYSGLSKGAKTISHLAHGSLYDHTFLIMNTAEIMLENPTAEDPTQIALVHVLLRGIVDLTSRRIEERNGSSGQISELREVNARADGLLARFDASGAS